MRPWPNTRVSILEKLEFLDHGLGLTCLLGNGITPVLAVMAEGLADILLDVLLAFGRDQRANDVRTFNANRYVTALA